MPGPCNARLGTGRFCGAAPRVGRPAASKSQAQIGQSPCRSNPPHWSGLPSCEPARLTTRNRRSGLARRFSSVGSGRRWRAGSGCGPVCRAWRPEVWRRHRWCLAVSGARSRKVCDKTGWCMVHLWQCQKVGPLCLCQQPRHRQRGPWFCRATTGFARHKGPQRRRLRQKAGRGGSGHGGAEDGCTVVYCRRLRHGMKGGGAVVVGDGSPVYRAG